MQLTTLCITAAVDVLQFWCRGVVGVYWDCVHLGYVFGWLCMMRCIVRLAVLCLLPCTWLCCCAQYIALLILLTIAAHCNCNADIFS